MMENENSNELRLFRAVVAITDFLREYAIEQNVQEDFTNATVRQLVVMKKVFNLTEEKKEGIPLKRLAEELHLTAGTVSEVVDTLVRKGGLERVVNPNDRRSVMIRLTGKSQHYQDVLLESSCKMMQTLLNELPEEDVSHLVNSMDILKSKLSKEKD